MKGKRRTRQHVISDLGVNFLEKQVLLAVYTLLRVQLDRAMTATPELLTSLEKLNQS